MQMCAVIIRFVQDFIKHVFWGSDKTIFKGKVYFGSYFQRFNLRLARSLSLSLG